MENGSIVGEERDMLEEERFPVVDHSTSFVPGGCPATERTMVGTHVLKVHHKKD